MEARDKQQSKQQQQQAQAKAQDQGQAGGEGSAGGGRELYRFPHMGMWTKLRPGVRTFLHRVRALPCLLSVPAVDHTAGMTEIDKGRITCTHAYWSGVLPARTHAFRSGRPFSSPLLPHAISSPIPIPPNPHPSPSPHPRIPHGMATAHAQVAALFELHVYTMGNRWYASEMARILDPLGTLFHSRIIAKGVQAPATLSSSSPAAAAAAAAATTPAAGGDAAGAGAGAGGGAGTGGGGQGVVVRSKDLEGVLGMESSVLIVDDSSSVWPHHARNLILVERCATLHSTLLHSTPLHSHLPPTPLPPLSPFTCPCYPVLPLPSPPSTSHAPVYCLECTSVLYTYFPHSRRSMGLPGPALMEVGHDERAADGMLASILTVLERIHGSFFASRQRGMQQHHLDVRSILAEQQRRVLAGCCIVFSRIFPVGEANARSHPLWRLAEQFGAVCTLTLCDAVTHVVALALGTDKVRQWSGRRLAGDVNCVGGRGRGGTVEIWERRELGNESRGWARG
ncbi:unnamed protein product [Closterium sp. NIES-54]